MKQLQLKPGKEGSILRKHPWIFSGALKDSTNLTPGEWAMIVSHKGELLGIGHVGDGSIAVRLIAHWDDPWLGNSVTGTFSKPQLLASLSAPIRTPDVEFWKGRLERAWLMRRTLNYGPKTSTNAFRLVHGEGDLLPGLIIDIYGDAAIIQAHTHGMLAAVKDIAEALQQIPELELVTMQTGQKTGFFLDQRENRALLRQHAAGKTVLNTFCYTGGFSIASLAGNAKHVTSVDISATAMELTNKNVELYFATNENPNNQSHESVTADVLQYLKNHLNTYDIVVLDPPAFAKSLNKKHQAVMGYKRLNALGINCVKPGGLLFTFSCSQVVDDVLFANTVTAAGIETGRNCKILYKLGQGPDHPVNLYHPEGHYLKGLVIQVD